MGQVQVVIDGMTASGKTTITSVLPERLSLRVMPEEFRDSYDLLNKFSQDKKWCFPMQLNFLVTRFIQYKVASETNDYILDRSIFSDPVYAQLYYQKGFLSEDEYNGYLSLYKTLVSSLTEPKCLLLLNCSFTEIMNRIKKRGREDELRLGEEYWRALYDAYQSHLDHLQKTSENCIYINTEKFDIVNNKEHLEEVIEQVAKSLNMSDYKKA